VERPNDLNYGNLAAGLYSATITDACVQMLPNIEITAPSPIQIIENDLQCDLFWRK
jgi:hypothetical protein